MPRSPDRAAPVAFLVCGVLAVAALTLASGCSRDRAGLASGGTDEITAELAAIADSLAPIDNPWANEGRLAYYTALPVPADPKARLQLQGLVAREFLNSGRSALAVQAFTRILETVQEYPDLAPSGYQWIIRQLLGLSYLRLGEQNNCIDNHSGGACILPIDAEAVHTAREGSEGAVRIYSELLAERPADLQSRWLLNIAYATLGTHPEGVPTRFRLSKDQLVGPATDLPFFRNIAPRVGLASVSLSGGGITEDFDGDNDLDVLVSSWGLRDSLRYFENLGNGRFVERSEAAGLFGLTGGLNLVHADYDNDGDFDVFVLRGAWLGVSGAIPNSLLRNDGNGHFQDVTIASGVYSRHPTQTAAWADYNNDGYLDLFVGNESAVDDPHRSELFRNNGDGSFTNVAAAVGVDVNGFVKGVTWIDFDNDGDPDLYVSQLGQPNRLFENNGSRFDDVTDRAGVDDPFQSFPVWSWDYDNDGWEDLLVLPYESKLEDYVAFQLSGAAESLSRAETPRLYRNHGDGTFSDETGAANLTVPLKAMGANFGDLDNDGLLDFYVGTGDPDLRSLVPNKMYRNSGTGFVDVTRAGFGHLQKGHAVSFADLDNDGDQDVHAVMGGALSGDRFQNALFENPGNGNNWITLTLKGRSSNRSGLGSRITIKAFEADGTVRIVRRTVTSGGSFGASSYRQSIGVGAMVGRITVSVRWPSGTEQEFESVQPDHFYLVDEVDGLLQQDVESFSF